MNTIFITFAETENKIYVYDYKTDGIANLIVQIDEYSSTPASLLEETIPPTIARKDYVDEKIKNIDVPEVPTPDWNAQEGEDGYIKNKPFSTLKLNLVFDEQDILLEGTDDFNRVIHIDFDEMWYNERSFAFNLDDRLDIVYNDEYFGSIERTDGNKFTLSGDFAHLNKSELEDIFSNVSFLIVYNLPEKYIPNTIARTSEIEGALKLLEKMKPITLNKEILYNLDQYTQDGLPVDWQNMEEAGLTKEIAKNIGEGYCSRVIIGNHVYNVATAYYVNLNDFEFYITYTVHEYGELSSFSTFRVRCEDGWFRLEFTEL